MTHLPVCERQPYSLFHNSPPLFWERACYDCSHDFMRQIGSFPFCAASWERVTCGFMQQGDGEGEKRGTGGENPEGEGGLQPGCPLPLGCLPKHPVERSCVYPARRASKTSRKQAVTKTNSTHNPFQEQMFSHFVHHHQKIRKKIGMHYGEKRIKHIDFAACVW